MLEGLVGMTRSERSAWAEGFFVAWSRAGGDLGDIDFDRAASLRDQGMTPVGAARLMLS